MEILFIAFTTVFAAGVGTLTGFGISMIMIPVVLFMYPLPQAILLVGIIHWFGDIWKLLLFKQGIRWKIILAFGIPGALTGFLGAYVMIQAPAELLSRMLGGFIICYVAFIWIQNRLSGSR